MSRVKIEIYLSETSEDDMRLLGLWNKLTREGRGRAQSTFRRHLFSLLSKKEKDAPSEYDINKKSKPGPKKTWTPSIKEEVRLPGTDVPSTNKEVVQERSEPCPQQTNTKISSSPQHPTEKPLEIPHSERLQEKNPDTTPIAPGQKTSRFAKLM